MISKQKKFYIETFGCQMNEFDSERIIFILENEGFIKSGNTDEADIILLNTCSVREKAENRLFGHLGSFKALKVKKPGLIICVGGCTAQSEGERLINKFPYIDIVFGTSNIGMLPALINERFVKNCSICNTGEFPGTFDYLYDFKRQYDFKALIPIMVGCNNFCSYCIVPFVRGRERSAEPEHIIKAIKKLADQGVIEIMLLGQNVNSYGKDLEDKSYGFGQLLRDVSAINGIKRIRFMTSHPKDFTEDIIDAISDNNNIMKHIHLPLQAGSDRILELMNRRYTIDKYKKLYYMIKEKIPGCFITTDIIVGFPGENEADFLKTLETVRELRFNRAFTFIYSQRKGTFAASIQDVVPDDIKRIWFRKLLDEQNNISLQENEKLVGKKFEVLVEGFSTKDYHLEGRLENNLIVNFNGNSNMIGKLIDIEITGAKSFYLTGRLYDNRKRD
jgi:tRNA-2-methylthio-N6-dimethylallyladenosine synthase